MAGMLIIFIIQKNRDMKIIEITSDLMLIKKKKRSVSSYHYNEESSIATFNCITEDGIPRVVIILLYGHPRRKRRRQHRDISICIMSNFNPLLNQTKWGEYFDRFNKCNEPIFKEAIEIYNNAKDLEIKVAKSFEHSGVLYEPEWNKSYYKNYGYYVPD